jgi:predicted RNase H-like HicB family nuclease
MEASAGSMCCARTADLQVPERRFSRNHFRFNEAITINPRPDDLQELERAYRLHVAITADDEGGYSAIALNLPGVGSSADTEDGALENIKEAFRGALESYAASNMEIPWRETLAEQIPPGAKQRWIVVNA